MNGPKSGSIVYQEALLNDRRKGLYENIILPKPKVTVKTFGDIVALGVNTHAGCSRSFNDDRVTILVNAQQKYEHML